MPSRMPALLYCAVRVHGHGRVFYDVRAVVHVHVPVLRRASERARACVISAAYLLAPGHAHCTRTRPCECSS